MSEFDKHCDGWAIASNCTEDEAKIHFEAGQQSQQAKIDDLTELNRLKTIALQQSVNRTSIHVHEKIVVLEKKLKGNKDEN